MIYRILLLIISFPLNPAFSQAVATVGALRQVMHQGKLAGQVQLDTLPGEHRYGLGPVAHLRGEILLWNDTAYVSRVSGQQQQIVTVEPDVAAPFLVYAPVAKWTTGQPLDSAISSLPQLQDQVERYARAAGRSLDEPFPFVISGTVQRVVYHVMNRPPDQRGHSPALHKQAKQFYTITQEVVQLLGFYSRTHRGVFTHHDSYIHVHVINQARTKMGHLDEIAVTPSDLFILFPV